MTGSPFTSWWALRLGEKIEVVGIVLLACAAEVAVKVLSLPRLTSALGITLGDHGRESAGLPTAGFDGRGAVEIDERARMVDRVYRHWPRQNSCLRRAVVLGFRIRKANPKLMIGVANENGEIRAHAWIEVDGEVVGDETGDWAPLRSPQTAG